MNNRREFLAAMTVGAAVGCSPELTHGRSMRSEANQSRDQKPAQGNACIHYGYKEPHDFGVMNGHALTDENLVSKRLGHPTCFMVEDDKRMRWALQNMSALQRTHTIARGGEVRRFSYRPVNLQAVKIPSVKRGNVSFEQWLELTETDGFMAVYLNQRNEPIVATEQYYNGLKPHTLHHLWSVSKSMSIGVAAIALEEGKLKRQDRVGDIVPGLADSGISDASLGDVLSMASGAKSFVGNEWTREALIEFAMDGFCSAGFLEGEDRELDNLGYFQFLQRVKKDPDRAHGAAFDYKSIDTQSAIAAAEIAFKRPFHQLLSELVWSKIGAEHDAQICCDQYGCSLTPFGMSATLRDCARWGLIHLPRCRKKILPERFVESLTESHPGYASKHTRKITPHPDGYRDQYWVYPSGPNGGFYAGGWMGQRIHMFPSLNVVIVQLATMWPDNYRKVIKDGPAFHQVAKYVAKAYEKM